MRFYLKTGGEMKPLHSSAMGDIAEEIKAERDKARENNYGLDLDVVIQYEDEPVFLPPSRYYIGGRDWTRRLVRCIPVCDHEHPVYDVPYRNEHINAYIYSWTPPGA